MLLLLMMVVFAVCLHCFASFRAFSSRSSCGLHNDVCSLSFFQDDLDHSGVVQKAILPAVDDVMAAVLSTTNSWKKERVQPLPETLAQQKGKTF